MPSLVIIRNDSSIASESKCRDSQSNIRWNSGNTRRGGGKIIRPEMVEDTRKTQRTRSTEASMQGSKAQYPNLGFKQKLFFSYNISVFSNDAKVPKLS